MTTTRFVYSVIRFAPDPGTGEYVNIGAIAGSEETDQWDMRIINTWGRVKALHRSASRTQVMDFLRPLHLLLEEHERAESQVLTETSLERLSADYRSAVQVSSPNAMLAVDVDEALETVFEQLVDDQSREYSRSIKRRTVHKNLRTAFVAANLTPKLDFRENIPVVAKLGFEGEIDFAVTRDQVRGLVQTWSFDIQDRDTLQDEIRSWGYLVERIRQGGAVIRTGAAEMRVAEHAPVEAVYVPPRDDTDPTYVDALRVFKDLGVTHQPVAQAHEVAARAQALLAIA